MDYFFKKNVPDDLSEKEKKALATGRTKRHAMPIASLIALSMALTLNNLGLGFGAGITGLNPYLTSAFTFFSVYSFSQQVWPQEKDFCLIFSETMLL